MEPSSESGYLIRTDCQSVFMRASPQMLGQNGQADKLLQNNVNLLVKVQSNTKLVLTFELKHTRYPACYASSL